jgi:hypothetical protein
MVALLPRGVAGGVMLLLGLASPEVRAQEPSAMEEKLMLDVLALTKRVQALEAAQKGAPATRVVAPFEVVDKAGRTIFRVMEGAPVGADVVITGGSAGDKAGLYLVAAGAPRPVAGIGKTSDGAALIVVRDKSGQASASLTTAKGTPSVEVANAAGSMVASMTSLGNAGLMYVRNASGSPVASVNGGADGGGAVIVANTTGLGVAQMSSGAEGLGLVQIFKAGSRSVAVLTQDGRGGLLQIKNASGTPVASFKTEAKGGGYWQLTDPAGDNVADAGFDGTAGLVRVGPSFVCEPARGTAIVGVAPLPDCIRGRTH